MKYLGPNEIEVVLREVHAGDYGSHMGGRRLFEQLIFINYFWPTMENDVIDFVRNCEACQRLGNLIHAPSVEMGSITLPWPFHTWSIDLINPYLPHQQEKSRYWQQLKISLSGQRQSHFQRQLEILPERKLSVFLGEFCQTMVLHLLDDHLSC